MLANKNATDTKLPLGYREPYARGRVLRYERVNPEEYGYGCVAKSVEVRSKRPVVELES